MTPEEAVADVVTQVFPGSTCQTWREAVKQFTHFRFRLVAGDRVWGLDHLVPDEILDAHPDAAARELVTRIKEQMREDMSFGVEMVYEMGKAEPVKVFTSPLTGMPMRSTGFTQDGWYDTDKARRDNSRLLELARIETERQEQQKAKDSILDTIAKRAMKDACGCDCAACHSSIKGCHHSTNCKHF